MAGPSTGLEAHLERLGLDAEDDGGARVQSKLVGSLHACSWCDAVETTPKLFRKCSRCKARFYCSPACQKSHWKNGHKAECGEGTTKSVDGTVECVIFPADGRRRPYAVRLPSADLNAAREHIAWELLGCVRASELKNDRVIRGEPHDNESLVVFHRRPTVLNTALAPNARASTIITPLPVTGPGASLEHLLPLGWDDPAVKVRGDAVVVRLADPEGSSKRLESFTYTDYDDNYGIFVGSQIDPLNDLHMTMLLPRSREGEYTAKLFTESVSAIAKDYNYQMPPLEETLAEMKRLRELDEARPRRSSARRQP